MKYEKPEMELVELVEQSVVTSSIGEDDTAVEGEEPGVNWT